MIVVFSTPHADSDPLKAPVGAYSTVHQKTRSVSVVALVMVLDPVIVEAPLLEAVPPARLTAPLSQIRFEQVPPRQAGRHCDGDHT